MPAFDHHFMPLHPHLEGDSYLQLESQGPINFETTSGNTLFVRFLCLDEQVRVIAVTVPKAATSHKDMLKWMKQIMEGAITAIRLTVDPEALPLLVGDGFVNLMYQADEPEPRYQVVMGFRRNQEYRLDINNVFGVFCMISNRTLAPIAALLAEGQVPTIPPQYRILSLIRAIELLYPAEGDRRVALERFEEHFVDLKLSDRPFRNALPELRTRCAHGRSRGREIPDPFVGIGYNEPHLLRLIVLLRSVIAHGLHVLHGLELSGVQHGIGPTDA